MIAPSQFIKSVGSATLANIIGRAANVLIPFTVIGLYGANPHTDKFFFFLAVAFYFYGTLSYAATESSVPILIQSRTTLSSRGILIIGLSCATLVLLVSFAARLLSDSITLWFMVGLALMAGAGIANGFATGILHAGEKYALPGLTWALRIIPLALFVLSAQPADSLHYLTVGIGLSDWLRLGLLMRMQPGSDAMYQLISPMVFLKRHFKVYLPFAMAMLIMGLNPIVDRLIANLSGPGGISILEAGDRLFGILSVLCTLGMMTVLLTQLSKAVHHQTLEKDWNDVLKMTVIWSTLWIGVGLLAGYGILGHLMSKAVSLTENQTLSVSRTYWFYLPGLCPLTLSIVYIKRLQAVQRAWTLAVASLVTVMLNIPASLVLHKHMGVPGIALATTLIHFGHIMMLVGAVHWHGRTSNHCR